MSLSVHEAMRKRDKTLKNAPAIIVPGLFLHFSADRCRITSRSGHSCDCVGIEDQYAP
jgi:hypothetical protein